MLGTRSDPFQFLMDWSNAVSLKQRSLGNKMSNDCCQTSTSGSSSIVALLLLLWAGEDQRFVAPLRISQLASSW